MVGAYGHTVLVLGPREGAIDSQGDPEGRIGRVSMSGSLSCLLKLDFRIT